MKRFLILGLLVLANLAPVLAQEPPRKGPDLQTAEPDFFDPTRKTAEAPYLFDVEWRIEAGFIQWSQRTSNTSYPDMYMNGGRIGGTVDFLLPKRFSVQTGLLATLTYGQYTQHWRSMDDENARVEQLEHNVLQLELTVPARVYYNIKLWKKLNMFFYTGPQLQVGLLSYDNLVNSTSDEVNKWLVDNNIRTYSADRYSEGELYRTSIQWGLGGGIEWDCYRLQGGYDFGLNNLVHNKLLSNQHLWEWGWMVSFSYRF